MDKFKDACSQSCQDWADCFDDTQEYQFSSAFESEMAKLPDEIETQKHRRPSKKTIAFMVNAAVVLCFCAAVLIIPATREQVVGIFKDYIPDSGISSGEDTTIWSDDKDYGAETDSDNSYNNWDGAIEFEFGSEDIGSINDGSSQTGSADNSTSPSENAGPVDDDTVTDGEELPSYKTLEVKLGYIPDGFCFDDSPLACGPEDDAQTEPKRKYYKNGDSRFDISKYTADISSKDEKYTTVKIDGIDYDVVERTDTIFVFWNKESAYFILRGTNISRDEMLKIASNAE